MVKLPCVIMVYGVCLPPTNMPDGYHYGVNDCELSSAGVWWVGGHWLAEVLGLASRRVGLTRSLLRADSPLLPAGVPFSRLGYDTRRLRLHTSVVGSVVSCPGYADKPVTLNTESDLAALIQSVHDAWRDGLRVTVLESLWVHLPPLDAIELSTITHACRGLDSGTWGNLVTHFDTRDAALDLRPDDRLTIALPTNGSNHES